MWFKNLRVYRLTEDIDLSENHIGERLASHLYEACGNHDFSRYGWYPPLGLESGMLTHSCNGQIMICARKQEKILPPAAVNEIIEEKVLELQALHGRDIYRKEKTNLKEEVIYTLLPRALTRSSFTYAYFSPKQKYLVVDAASSAKAEEFLDCLRTSLGSLPVVPLECTGDMADIMTHWLKNQPPKGFELDNECELRNARNSNNTVRCRNQELESDEIIAHIKSGKRVTQLALCWQEAIRFVLTEEFAIKRVKFEELITTEAVTDAEDAATQFDQDFAVMSLQLNELLDQMVSAFAR